MIAMTTGLEVPEGAGPFGHRDSVQVEINSELGYLYFPLGARRVTPQGPEPPP